MILPTDWHLVSADEQSALFVADFLSQTPRTMSIITVPGDAGINVDDFMLYVESNLQQMFEGVSLNLSGREQVTLADGSTAEVSTYQLNGIDNGPKSSVHTLWKPRGEDIFVITITTDDAYWQRHEDAFQAMYASLSFGAKQDYALPPEETVTLHGGKPEPEDLDPARTQGSAGMYTGMLFSGLVRLTPDMQIVPDLADHWDISPDGTVYTFTLRSDARFADGSPITAEDVRESWEYAAKPGTDSQTVTTYLGDIVGLVEKHNGKAKTISGLQVVDEHTLVVTLDAPKPYFLAKLTYPVAFVVDIHDVYRDPTGWMFAPNSSGPYKVKEERDTALILERNPEYHTPAHIPYLVFRYFLTGDAVSTFQNGDLDMVYLPISDAAAITSDPESPVRANLRSTQRMCTPMYMLNTSLAPFDDINVRRAFALSIDRQKLNEQFFYGLGAPAYTILPPGMPGYTEGIGMPAYDPQAAREALAASAYGSDLPEITLLTSGFASNEDPYTTAIINMWQETLGVHISVQYADPLDMLKVARQTPAHLVSMGWCADYPDPQNFLDVLFSPESDFNLTHYQNPEVSSLLEQANTSLEPAERVRLYQQAEALILQDFAAIPLVRSSTFALVSDRLDGTVLTPIGVPVWDKVRLK
ncbi:MAG: peptide ABC transporter substrate-binding protein [Anaerolineae bacterium]|nr:MAG: peptide ABC transporter substrate-binding protein [Anaerolineae bacterium]